MIKSTDCAMLDNADEDEDLRIIVSIASQMQFM